MRRPQPPATMITPVRSISVFAESERVVGEFQKGGSYVSTAAGRAWPQRRESGRCSSCGPPRRLPPRCRSPVCSCTRPTTRVSEERRGEGHLRVRGHLAAVERLVARGEDQQVALPVVAIERMGAIGAPSPPAVASVSTWCRRRKRTIRSSGCMVLFPVFLHIGCLVAFCDRVRTTPAAPTSPRRRHRRPGLRAAPLPGAAARVTTIESSCVMRFLPFTSPPARQRCGRARIRTARGLRRRWARRAPAECGAGRWACRFSRCGSRGADRSRRPCCPRSRSAGSCDTRTPLADALGVAAAQVEVTRDQITRMFDLQRVASTAAPALEDHRAVGHCVPRAYPGACVRSHTRVGPVDLVDGVLAGVGEARADARIFLSGAFSILRRLAPSYSQYRIFSFCRKGMA